MVNPATCTLYELYDARYSPGGSTAGSGAIWNLRSNALRPAGWTSADAAGLPILPGLLRYDEVESGTITHAIRMTAETTDTSYLWPARHEAGARSNPNLPPMGARFRLKASFDISGLLAPGPGRAPGHATLRPHPRRQRQQLVLRGHGRPGVAAEPGRRAQAGPGERVRGGGRVLPHGEPDSGQARQLGVSVNCGSGPGYRLVAADGGIFSFCQSFRAPWAAST